MYEIRFRLEAYVDLEEIESYYSEISLSIVSMFFKEFSKTLNFIERQPNIFQERYRKIRIAHLYKFPYGIHYKITDNVVTVYRILHTKRYFKQ